jgi:hypothetical protein
MTVVTDEDAAQIERLKYVLSQSVKANLVERVYQWPGVHSAGALIDGTPLEGHWFDRAQEFAARPGSFRKAAPRRPRRALPCRQLSASLALRRWIAVTPALFDSFTARLRALLRARGSHRGNV